VVDITQFDKFCADHGNQYPFDSDDMEGYENFCNEHEIDFEDGYRTLDPFPRNACDIDSDCIGINKCKIPDKCKCRNLKCRSKRKDCLTRGTEDERKLWNCEDGKTCVGKIKPSGKITKWGKCK